MGAKKEKKQVNWLNPKTTAKNEVLPGYFNWAWSSRGMSLALNIILVSQLTYYCTDMLNMPPGLVGTLLLLSKVVDGVTDMFAGFVVDRTHTRLGKARPYEVFIVFAWLLTGILYSAPEMGLTGKVVFVFVLYVLINAICVTMLNAADVVYLVRSVRGEQNRVSVSAFNGVMILIFSTVVTILFPQIIATIGVSKAGWSFIGWGFAIPLAVIGLCRFLFIKEVIMDRVDASAEGGAAKSLLSLKESVGSIFQNKYILLLAAMTFLANLLNGLGAVGNYYFKYIMGDIGLGTIVGIGGLLTPIFIMFYPMLARKFGTVSILRAGALCGILGIVIRIVGGDNLLTLAIGGTVMVISLLPIQLMINVYLIDAMDYGEWKTGKRVEGMMASVNSFFAKVGMAAASGIMGFVMGLGGYDGALAVQPASALLAIRAVLNYIPLVIAVLFFILTLNYGLDKLLPRIREDLEQKRSQADGSEQGNPESH